jgi:hypothetical protein
MTSKTQGCFKGLQGLKSGLLQRRVACRRSFSISCLVVRSVQDERASAVMLLRTAPVSYPGISSSLDGLSVHVSRFPNRTLPGTRLSGASLQQSTKLTQPPTFIYRNKSIMGKSYLAIHHSIQSKDLY